MRNTQETCGWVLRALVSPFVPSPHTNTDLLSTQSVMSSQNSLRQAASIAITQSMAF